MIQWIIPSIIILLILGLMVAYRNKGKKQTDYRGLFNIGVIWLAIGIAYPLVFGRPLELSAITTMGLIFTIAGLANKSKWKN